ncbi:MAG: DUF2157 domain-containing protein [Longimicrobiales bacterium]
MSLRQDIVNSAIDRWLDSSIIDAETAERLKADESAHAAARSTRTSQYVLAITGAVVLVIAGGVFLTWAWPRYGEMGRTIILTVAAVAVTAGGILLESRGRWKPSSYALQTAGIGLLFSAYVYSEQVWPDQSLGGTLFGLSALVIPVILTPRAMRRDPFMPGVHLITGLGFLAVFLDRSTPLSGDGIIWILDAVLIAGVLSLLRTFRSDETGDRHPWALNAFILAIGAGFLLVALTAFGPLSLDEEAFIPIDLWWALSVTLTVRELEQGTPRVERTVLERLLSLQCLAWVGLGSLTAHETFHGGPGLATLIVSTTGVAFFAYADRRQLDSVLIIAAVTFVIPIWAWAVDAAGALGGIAALVLTAALLFWAAGRRGSAEAR